jgi:low affinity Fe/Cu permease
MNEKMLKMKKVSRIIKVIAKIGSIMTMIGIVVMAIVFAVTPYVVTQIDRGEVIEYIDKSGEPISFRCFDRTEVIELKPILENYSNARIVTIIYAIALMPITGLVLVFALLEKVYKLFKNISLMDTPFTEENSKHVKDISKIILALIIAPIPFSIIFKAVSGIDLDLSFNLTGLVYALVAIALGYIFEYGYELQKESDATL